MARPKRTRANPDTTLASTSRSATVISENAVPEEQVEGVGERPRKKRKYGKSAVIRSNQNVVLLQDSSAFRVLCEDILIEIFSYLKPLDLLHLSWSGKCIHNFLTSKSFAFIWKKARKENILEGIPNCPLGVTEPLYANLMFSNHCFYCFKQYDRSEMRVCWSGRFRTCIKCLGNSELFLLHTYAEELRDEAKLYRGYPRHLFQICHPKVTYGNKDYLALEPLKKWKKEYDHAKNQYKWEENKFAECHSSQPHGHECREWLIKYSRYLRQENQEMILKHIGKIGWEKELNYPVDPITARPLYDKTIQAAYAKESLSETDLIALEPRINEIMAPIRAERLELERRRLLLSRIPILMQAVKLCRAELPPNAITPNVADLFQVPLALDIITSGPEEENFTIDNLNPLIEAYPEISRQWRLAMEAKLVAMIESACGESYRFKADTVLHLATTMFSCEQCKRKQTPLWYPRVLIHNDATSVDPHSSDLDISMLFRMAKVTSWNATHQIGFLDAERIALSNVLRELGFNPDSTTAEEMDALDIIFECVSCSDPRQGRFTMKWTHLAYHLLSSFHQEHQSTPKQHKIEMLDGEAAQSIRDRFAEDNAPDRNFSSRTRNIGSMICVHCRHMEEPARMADHLWTQHEVEDPTDADMVPHMDVVPIVHCRYSWPPRKVERRPVVPVEGTSEPATN